MPEQQPLRVVVWSTGTVGRHAIAGIDAHPGRELGIAATTDRERLLALGPDAIVHTAMTDDRVFEAVEDLIGFLEAGVNVTSSGPVLLQWPEHILPPEM